MGNYLSKSSKRVVLSPIRRIFELASRTPGLVRLEVGEPDFPTPPHIIEKTTEVLQDGRIGYTASAGIPEARAAVSKRLEEDYDLKYDPNSEIVICSGGINAIYILLRTVIDPGDHVLIPDPGYPAYKGVVDVIEGIPVAYPLVAKKGFSIDFDKLETLITSKTKAIVVNSPSNPLGNVIDEEQSQKLLDLISDKDILILYDQAYDKIVYDKPHVPIASLKGGRDKVVIIGSASKNYAMCGWRIGYTAGPKDITEEVMKFQSLANICPSYVSQMAAVAAFGGTQEPTAKMREEYKRRRDFFVNGLNSIPGMKCYVMPEGAFYAFPDISAYGMNDWDFSEYLIKEVGVTCIPGSAFGEAGKGFVRMSYANSMDNLEEALIRLEKHLKHLV